MKLSKKHALSFLNTYKPLLEFIFIKEFGEEIDTLEDYHKARNILYEDTSVVDEFISQVEELGEDQLEILENTKKGIKDTFVYLKTLKKHSLLFRASTNQFYCVLGITDSLEEIVPDKFTIAKTVIMQFEKKIICDGLFASHNVTIGPNMKKNINAEYKKARENKKLIHHITSQ